MARSPATENRPPADLVLLKGLICRSGTGDHLSWFRSITNYTVGGYEGVKTVKAKQIIGGVIIVVFLIWGGSAFLKTTIQYVSIEQARTSDIIVQTIGKIDFDAVHYDREDSRLEFDIYDPEAVDEATAERLKVVYYGVPPGNFEQATSVVLKGKPDDDNVFVADQMLVKCPSKYQGEEGEEYQDAKKHDEAVGNATDTDA